MVMHARKPQRISDGYFEKHQTHPYQKYNSKIERRNSDYIPDARYASLRSPNGNVFIHGHGHGGHTGHSAHSGHHHYSHVPDERPHAIPRNAYMQKDSEKERDRDYKSSRNKYTDSVRSPKDKRIKECDREKNNHERCESEKKSRSTSMNCSVRSNKYDKRSAVSSVPPGSEWSEHISSSGKKYYYNSISEVSQWEKPREWDSRRTTSKDSSYSTRSNREREKRTRSRSRSGRREAEQTRGKRNNASDRYWSGRDDDSHPHDRQRPKHSHDAKEGQAQDMDISPDRSTPLSEGSYAPRSDPRDAPRSDPRDAPRSDPRDAHRSDPRDVPRSDPRCDPRSDPRTEHAVPPVVVLDNSNNLTGSLLAAALPRIVATPMTMGGGVVGMCAGGMTGAPGMVCAPAMVGAPCMAGGSTPHRDAGPPTPTHSENTDPHAPPLHLDAALPRKMECLGSYSSVVGGPLQHAMPMLTPTLMNYVRTDLTAHVASWPADILEKQANKFMEEAYQLGCLQCTRVSAELKCARSVVRHTEIQATLQEQKVMYLRQQIKRLEELKSLNSFMSDD